MSEAVCVVHVGGAGAYSYACTAPDTHKSEQYTVCLGGHIALCGRCRPEAQELQIPRARRSFPKEQDNPEQAMLGYVV